MDIYLKDNTTEYMGYRYLTDGWHNCGRYGSQISDGWHNYGRYGLEISDRLHNYYIVMGYRYLTDYTIIEEMG